ncbi:hypothetical protein NPIL_474571 [Nephila pilipes]|uniref:Uncharacterized protein n=1 Tax=Nephila pilipes TaxID=299642 RepID=A0A8X6PW18_NEPPI|nr:hypothetical protein NPIL_474571 [Nephila pilipes]
MLKRVKGKEFAISYARTRCHEIKSPLKPDEGEIRYPKSDHVDDERNSKRDDKCSNSKERKEEMENWYQLH